MTISNLRCDICGGAVSGPGGGVRFVYHPGRAELRDSSGLLCGRCWDQTRGWLGEGRVPRSCAVCGEAVARQRSLHLHPFGEAAAWRLCLTHAVEFLNRLCTVEPKLDPATFRFPFADRS
jgi:hypothetical protein